MVFWTTFLVIILILLIKNKTKSKKYEITPKPKIVIEAPRKLNNANYYVPPNVTISNENENRYINNNKPVGFSNHRLQITYRDANGDITKRIVQPRELYNDNGYKFMKTFCELRQEERTFMFSRIKPPVINISTGEIIDLSSLVCKEILTGPRGGKYTLDANGKKHPYR